ncbi:hypothetical protein [Kitasatospora sp. NPDC094015]|uniref:hypothetical protein n=1 Tax=Kitasatospora sp. NPDC094015 TaxID=3155205 RepID=UPI003327F07C
MAENSRPDLRIVEGVDPTRLHGEVCFVCGSAEPPLHPAGTVETRVGEGVVRRWDIVACTEHVELER